MVQNIEWVFIGLLKTRLEIDSGHTILNLGNERINFMTKYFFLAAILRLVVLHTGDQPEVFSTTIQ